MTTGALTLFYCDHFDFPLPEGHKFPLAKYRLIRERLRSHPAFDLRAATPATREEVLAVHDREYVGQFLGGTLPANVSRRIGLPWSPEFVQRTLASVGGTLLAARHAARFGFGGTLAGGTHHACRDAGSGFCVFNDLAVAIHSLRAQSGIERFAIIDLDVHQGDGTAAIFAGDTNVFTLSMHGAHNFPFRKQQSRLDIALEDGSGDDVYLEKLGEALEDVRKFQPQLLLYQSGVDALGTDRLGRLSLTPEGLVQRDAQVFSYATSEGLPLVVTLGGGYSDPIELTVDAHQRTFETAANFFINSR